MRNNGSKSFINKIARESNDAAAILSANAILIFQHAVEINACSHSRKNHIRHQERDDTAFDNDRHLGRLSTAVKVNMTFTITVAMNLVPSVNKKNVNFV